MTRLAFVFLAFLGSNAARGSERVIPVFSGTIADRTYRTTVDLRSATAEECRFEVRTPDGAVFQSMESVDAGTPKLLDEFAAEIQPAAILVTVSCTGAVDVHSRLHESADGGVTYAEGSLFRAVVPQRLVAGQTRGMVITSDFIVAEIHGASARVTATLIATTTNGIADKDWHLAPFGQRMVLMTKVLRSRGPVEANFVASGEGEVIILQAINDPSFAAYARRPPPEVRARLHTEAAVAARPPARQLLPASFKAAPFQEPATGLILMRDRWYDPNNGSFLTPDPLGHQDSSNLYNFCGGDPVNCSDPTGRAASVNQKGDIIGIRPDGSRYFISAAEARADSVITLRVLESDHDLGYDEQEEIMTRAGLPIPVSSACRADENCLSGKRTNLNAFTHLPRNGKWGEAAFIATTGLPPQTREQQLLSGGVQIASAAIPAAAAGRARARGGVGPGIQPVFNTRAGVPVGVNSHMDRVEHYVSTVTVYRVESPANARVTIEANGDVTISNGNAMLFLNFGDPIRAQQFFAQRLGQRMFGVTMKSFEVPSWFLYQLQVEAVAEVQAGEFPSAALRVDESKAPNQYGLRPAQVDQLRGAIIPGSGRQP